MKAGGGESARGGNSEPSAGSGPWAATVNRKPGMSISAPWPFAATSLSISTVNITVEPAHSGLPFGAAPPTAEGVLFVSEQIGGASYACLVWVTGAAQLGLPHEGMPTRIAAGTGATIR